VDNNEEGNKMSDKVAASVLAKALLFLLRDHEGIFVETPDGQFVVGSTDGGISIDDRRAFTVVGHLGDAFADGSLVWLHDTQEEAELAAAFDSGEITMPPGSTKSTATH